MTRTDLGNGLIKLKSESGIIDLRTGKIYSVVVVNARKERFFISAN